MDTLIEDLTKQGKIEQKAAKKEDQKGQAPAPGQPTTVDQNAAAVKQNAGEAGEKAQGKGAEQQKRSLIGLVDELLKKEKEVSIKEGLKELESQLQRAPDDATELLNVPQFKKLQDTVFVSREMPKKPLFLMDLFTTQESAKKLNPWLLSNSVKTLLGFTQNSEVKIKELVKNIKPSMNWATDWDKSLAKLYGKKFQALDKNIVELLATGFEATAFFVVSYCKVGSVTQKIGALLELTEPGPGVEPKSFIFRVTKLYWL